MTDKHDDLDVATREDDHETSIAAAKKIGRKSVTLRERVFDLLMEHPEGLSQTEVRLKCEQRYGPRSESSYRKRISELADMALVQRTGHTKINAFGNHEAVWRAVPPGGRPDFTLSATKKRDMRDAKIESLNHVIQGLVREIEHLRAKVKDQEPYVPDEE